MFLFHAIFKRLSGLSLNIHYTFLGSSFLETDCIFYVIDIFLALVIYYFIIHFQSLKAGEMTVSKENHSHLEQLSHDLPNPHIDDQGNA